MTQRALTRSVDQFHEAVLVGRRIRWLREQCGLSRAAVAAYAGVSERTLARVESGERRLLPNERTAIARAIGSSITILTAIKPRVAQHPPMAEPELSEGEPQLGVVA
jgi:transcriptional regulator with XRE-family HTH domain